MYSLLLTTFYYAFATHLVRKRSYNIILNTLTKDN